MNNVWLNYLKNALHRQLPEDSISSNKKYGRLRDNLKYIYPSVLKNWKLGLFCFACLILSSLLAFPMPLISKYFVDNVLVKRNMGLFIPVLIAYAIVAVLNRLLGIAQSFSSTRFTQEVTIDIQSKLLNSVFALPKAFFDHVQKGYLMSRLTSGTSAVNWFISGTISQVFIQGIKFIGGMFFIFYLEWRIALPLMFFLPFPVIITKYFGRRSYIMSHQNMERSAKFNSVFQEIISSVPLVKAFSREKSAEAKIIGEMRANNALTNEQQMLGFVNGMVMEVMPKIATAFVVIFGAYWVITGHWTIGALWAFRSYFGYVLGPVNYLASSMGQLQSNRASLERVAALFRMAPEENTVTGIKTEKLKGNIEFKNVSFGYEPEKEVLKNVSFKALEGEHWAVIGPSGIGKTTLVSLILRFYKPNTGALYFDELDASEYNVRALRKRIGYVSQKTELYSGTIADNLKFSNEDATMEEIVSAAKVADIHSFIESLPNRYDTVLEEFAANLSEGQKQRISIARALVRNPDILILDEPTASLDNVTEHNIYSLMPQVVKKKTTFTIAHRLNTVKNVDKVIFFRDGMSPLIGTHNELMEDAEYKNFFSEN